MALATTAHAQRQRVSIDDGWQYASGAEAAAPDDGWTRVDLPHTWNADDVADGTYRRGFGWYRKTLRVEAPRDGRRRYLFFEGANQIADVWVNGREVGRHVGGYTAFAFDVTDALADGASEVVVRVDNRHNPDVPPLDADFTFYGGIYRSAWLITTDPVHLSFADAAPNVWLTTPGLAEGDTRVRALATVVNEGRQPAEVEVVHTLHAPDGEALSTFTATAALATGASETVEAWSPPVLTVQLWSPETPAVYRVRTEVRVDGEARDAIDNPLGFRWVSADGDGFYLNGEYRQLIGANRHQDHAGLGNALPDALHRRDVQLVKDTGFDFLRLAHYPQASAVLEETDRLGLLVWEEIPVVNQITQSEAFAANAETRLREMIRQHHNHPSIAIWGYMNEILLKRPDPMPEGYLGDVHALAARLEAVTKEEDPSRLTAMAISFNEVEDRVADVADIFALNLYFGWYHDTFADLGPFLDSLHAAHPDVPLMISEYGAGSDERIHAADPVRFDFSIEHAENFHRATFNTIRERPWMVGGAVWNQFDFGSAFRQDTKDGINQKGLFYYDRTPKDVAFWYRAALSDEPVVHIERDHLHRAGPHRQRVEVISNATLVRLRVNGHDAGTVQPSDGLAVATVEMRPGENRIEAEAIGRSAEIPPDGLPVDGDAATFFYSDPAAFFEGTPEAPSAIALNVGAPHSFTSVGGLVYLAEADWPGEPPAEGRARRTHHRIAGTDEDARFQTFREMPETWTLPSLPAGTYDLTFGFAEMDHAAAGSRSFSVRVDGQPVATDLDLAAEAGRWTAVERTVRLVLTNRQPSVVTFDSEGASPVLSTLVLRRR